MKIQLKNTQDDLVLSREGTEIRVFDKLGGGDIIETTYANLVSLKSASGLTVGAMYRITDYVTTTTQTNTQSAGHQFDVIVTATDAATLNENAWAIKHSGDTYFANSDLSAWELKYDINNDTTKYAWADSTNGKGVIYYMKDEWNNECPYDFKNIMFKRWAITNITSTKLTTEALNGLKEIFVYAAKNGYKHFGAKDLYGNFIPNSEGISASFDENEFGWYYTFNGTSSEDGKTINESYDLSTKYFSLSDECLEYVEGEGRGTNVQDSCYNNKIELMTQEYFVNDVYFKGRHVLNNIVFVCGLSYCYHNEDDVDWEYKVSSCYGNSFGTNCYDNTFGNNCYDNSFGNGCYSNTFGNSCYSNTFGNSCNRNTFGNNCYYNTFGNDCYRNTFGNYCNNNTFGNYFRYNSFGNGCNNNTFGNDCYYNTFGTSCNRNTFGNYCYNNTFGNYFQYNTFGNECYYNTFGNNCYYNTFGNDCNYINALMDYMRWIIVENGNKYITISCSKSTSWSNYLQNITIGQGANNATQESGRRTITHATVKDAFCTTYYKTTTLKDGVVQP